MQRQGVIVHVNKDGLVVVEDPDDKERFGFTFGKIGGYAGESARELRLREGTHVRFEEENDRVTRVELMDE